MIEWAESDQLISTIVNELVELEFKRDIKGIAVVIMRQDGDLRTLIAYNNGAKLPLLAGTVFLQNEIAAQCPRETDRCSKHGGDANDR